jgi:hypothetical protein
MYFIDLNPENICRFQLTDSPKLSDSRANLFFIRFMHREVTWWIHPVEGLIRTGLAVNQDAAITF